MSEIVLALGVWFSVILYATDSYFRKKTGLIILHSVAALGLLGYGLSQIGDTDFWEIQFYYVLMGIWFPLFAWSSTTKTRALILQNGESSLNLKYGAPKLKLVLLEDRKLAKMVTVSQISLWVFIGLVLVMATANNV